VGGKFKIKAHLMGCPVDWELSNARRQLEHVDELIVASELIGALTGIAVESKQSKEFRSMRRNISLLAAASALTVAGSMSPALAAEAIQYSYWAPTRPPPRHRSGVK
jgi:hypothetical protein